MAGRDYRRWYTLARRFPKLIGKLPDGVPIWGGPYQIRQVVAFAATAAVMVWTIPVWARFGAINNAGILIFVVAGVVVMVGRWPIGARNIVSATLGWILLITAPRWGRYRDKWSRSVPRWAPPRYRPVSRTVVALPAVTQPLPAPALEPAAIPVVPVPAPARPSMDQEPVPAPRPTGLTAIQALLVTDTSRAA